MTDFPKEVSDRRVSQHESHDNFFRPCDQSFLKPRDKNLAAAKSNSQRPFYHSSDFDSTNVVFCLRSTLSTRYSPAAHKQYKMFHANSAFNRVVPLVPYTAIFMSTGALRGDNKSAA